MSENHDKVRALLSPTASYLLETFVTLLLVLAAAGAILWGARRLGGAQKSGPLELVGRLPLEPRRAVYLVRIGETILVIGSSEAGLTKLAELATTDVPRGEKIVETPFAKALAKALGKTEPP